MNRLLCIAAASCVLALAGCGPGQSDETRIRQAIETMATAMEEGRPEPFLERVADDFSGDRGSWDRHRVRQYVLAQTIRRGKRPEIDISIGDVELFDGRARASVKATFRGDGRWLPVGGARYRFDTGWRLEDGDWRVIRADWERLDR